MATLIQEHEIKSFTLFIPIQNYIHTIFDTIANV